MPALRQRLFRNRAAQAHLTETRGPGRKLVYLRASVSSFATEEHNEGSRPPKTYRLAEHLLKSPIGETFHFDDVTERKYPVDLAAMQTLPVGGLLPVQFRQLFAAGEVAFREVPFLLTLLNAAVPLVVLRVARPSLALKFALQLAYLAK